MSSTFNRTLITAAYVRNNSAYVLIGVQSFSDFSNQLRMLLHFISITCHVYYRDNSLFFNC